jgi:hypothetical protein
MEIFSSIEKLMKKKSTNSNLCTLQMSKKQNNNSKIQALKYYFTEEKMK